MNEEKGITENIPGKSVESTSDAVLKPDTSVKFDELRCSTCREVKRDDQLLKQPLDYKKNEDGSVTPIRYSIFCAKCQMFLCIYDPEAAKELKDLIDNRNKAEAKKS